MVLNRNPIYHIYNRGNHKEKICRDKKDYLELVRIIYKSFPIHDFDLLSYCIMPNHYHLLVVKVRGRNIPRSMQDLGSQYTKYYNKRYQLVGHLFQGSYKSKRVKTAVQLQKVSQYIVENPEKINLSTQGYPWLLSNSTLIDIYTLQFYSLNY